VKDGLLPGVARGDPADVRACIARYAGRVHDLARRYLGPADADDAAQDVFIDLWRSAERYDPRRGSEDVFVMTLARRRCIDRRRRLAARPSPEPLSDAVPSPECCDAVTLCDEAARAKLAMNELSADQQTAIQLAVCDGLTHDAVAKRMGVPLGTVKSHIRRGLQRVRAALGGGDP